MVLQFIPLLFDALPTEARSRDRPPDISTLLIYKRKIYHATNCFKPLYKEHFKYWSIELHKDACEEHYELNEIGGPFSLWTIGCNGIPRLIALEIGKSSYKIPVGRFRCPGFAVNQCCPGLNSTVFSEVASVHRE